MKFTNGHWQFQQGHVSYFARQTYEVEADAAGAPVKLLAESSRVESGL